MWNKKIKILLCLLCLNISFAQDFETWKQGYLNRVGKRGINKEFAKKLIDSVTVNEDVLKLDKKQVILDKNRDYQAFIKRWLRDDNKRIEQGKQMLKDNLELLEQVEKKYNVDKEIIVSLWGVETFYGQITGDRDLIESLTTLAFASRRKKFFEIQLNASIRLLQQGHINRENLKGSWAGATGQCQFMPSNFKIYAQDFDGDGKKDIWTNKADIFASIAYFLKKVGWKKGKSIGELAMNPKDIGNKDQYRTKAQYLKLGFEPIFGQFQDQWNARRFSTIPMKNSPVVLRGSNYKPLLIWNRSSLFAAFNILLSHEFKKLNY